MELIAVPKELILRTIASLDLVIVRNQVNRQDIHEDLMLSNLVEEYKQALYPTIERL